MIMEFRTYTMRPGSRDAFARFFAEEAAPRMRDIGMTVLGPFRSLTDTDELAYARTFDSVEERERLYRVYYESQDWLGWMIDTAMGQEESFVVFLGGSDDETLVQEPTTALSGVHPVRFTLASITGPVREILPEAITVTGVDGDDRTFALPPEVRVFSVDGRGGMRPAARMNASDLAVGDTVLVLGSAGEVPTARQIVRRPG